MPRYHDIVIAYEGECSQCGKCCSDCGRLYEKNGKKLCRDHPDDKPSHCLLYPLGYAVELMPEGCTIRPTKTIRIDEVKHTGRIRVAERTGPALFSPVAAEEDAKTGKEETLYDLHGRLDAEHQEVIYSRTPEQHLTRIERIVERLKALEVEHGFGPDRPLDEEGVRQSEKLLAELLIAATLYATRRDLLIGDVLAEPEKDD